MSWVQSLLRDSTSLVTREMQMKTKKRYHLLFNIKEVNHSKYGQGDSYSLPVGNKLVHAFGPHRVVEYKQNLDTPHQSQASILEKLFHGAHKCTWHHCLCKKIIGNNEISTNGRLVE